MKRDIFTTLVLCITLAACAAQLELSSIDTTAPALKSTNPQSNTAISPNTAEISFQSDETLDASTSSVTLVCDGNSITIDSISFSDSDMSLIASLGENLPASADCQATWTIRDSTGNETTVTIDFSTSDSDDTTAPAMDSTTPPDGGTNISTALSQIQFVFSEAMDATRCAAGNITCSPSVSIESCEYSTTDNSCSCTLSGSLAASTTYQCQVSGQRDTAGNSLADSSISFTTGTTADRTAPTVVTTIPDNGDVGFSIIQAIFVCFSETLADSECRVTNINSTPDPWAGDFASCTVTSSPGCAGTEHRYDLDFDGGDSFNITTLYTFTIQGVSDPSGNTMQSHSWSATSQN